MGTVPSRLCNEMREGKKKMSYVQGQRRRMERREEKRRKEKNREANNEEGEKKTVFIKVKQSHIKSGSN